VVATRRSLACLQALWSLGIGAFIAISVQRRTLFYVLLPLPFFVSHAAEAA
jgi:hypothetical protein